MRNELLRVSVRTRAITIAAHGVVGGLACLLAFLLPASSAFSQSALPPVPQASGVEFLSYEELRARGLPVPVLLPDVPICHFEKPMPGFRSPAEMEAVVDDYAEPICQNDPRTSTFMVGEPLKTTPAQLNRKPRPRRTPIRTLQDTGYHFVGPSGTNYVRHGGRAGFEVRNPNVTHGGPTEFVAARSLAQGTALNWVEAGWLEDTRVGDIRAAYTCANGGTCWIDSGQSYPLTHGESYAFRSHHCGSPGQNLVCGQMWYGFGWVNLVSWSHMHCTNADSSPNCRVENLVEVYSEDPNDPHPHLGNEGGIGSFNGYLQVGTGTWDLWTTIYGTPNQYSTYPYTLNWDFHWYQFRACQGTC
jgi:hypothetical protein